jgi:hypothetical protein
MSQRVDRRGGQDRRIVDAVALGLTFTSAITILAFLDVQIIDDAYISFRYAEQLAQGNGLVFNVGERVEGITNLLWTLLLAAISALGLPVAPIAAALGTVLGALALRDAWRASGALGARGWGPYIGVAAVAVHPAYWLALSNGLEAGLAAFLIMRMIYYSVSGRSRIWVGVTGGLLFLTRPDSLVLLPVFLAYELMRRVAKEGLTDRRVLLRLVTPWLGVVALATAWRLWYYGVLLPNTLEAKSMPDFSVSQLSENTREGLRYIVGFLVSMGPVSVGALPALALVLRHRGVLFLALVLGAQAPAVIVNGGDWMPYYRLLQPYVPVMATLVGTALWWWAQRGSRQGLGRRWYAGVAALATIVWVAVIRAGYYPWEVEPRLSVRPSESCWDQLAQTMEPALRPSDRVAAEALGLISFVFPANYFHDLLGLTDREVARYGTLYYPTYGKAHPEYTFHSVRPDLIILHSGLGHLTPMVAASDGEYGERYDSFSLDLQCPQLDFVMSIRSDETERFQDVLSQMGARPFPLPPHEETN